MSEKFQEQFIRSSAVLLSVAAGCVLLATTADTRLLDVRDPLLFLAFRKIFFIFADVLLAASAFLLWSNDAQRRLLLIGWLADVGLVYHFGSLYYGVPVLCACGSGWGIAPRTVNAAVIALLVWLLAGSAIFLVGGWLSRRRAAKPVSPKPESPATAAA